MNSSDQGKLGEAFIIAELVKQGYEIFVPIFGNASCDLIVLKNKLIYKVECKACARRDKSGSWLVELRQTRTNMSGATVKKFNSDQCDLLAVYLVEENRVVIFEAGPLNNRTAVSIKAIVN